MVRAHWNGAVIAESDDTVIIEGNHYFPPDSVKREYLVESTTTTVCQWKGTASYFSLDVDGLRNQDAAWAYPTPSSAAEEIAGRFAFWHGVQVDAGPAAPRRSFLDRFRRSTAGADATPAAHEEAVDAVTDLDDASFSAALDHNVTVVDFWAPWCGPCKQLHPMFDAQAAAHRANGLQFARVDVDQNPAVASTLGIMSIPTIIVFDGDGKEVEREIGLPGKRRLEQLTRGAELLAGKIAGQGAA